LKEGWAHSEEPAAARDLTKEPARDGNIKIMVLGWSVDKNPLVKGYM
jgi:hypothetical protein